jgi:hypothetical protein
MPLTRLVTSARADARLQHAVAFGEKAVNVSAFPFSETGWAAIES